MIRQSWKLLIFAMLATGCSNGTRFGVAPTEDTFSSTLYNNKVDIVWLVDDSSSMNIPQQKLAQTIPEMVSVLNSLKLDYRMVVTTTSMGNGFTGGRYIGNPAVLTASTPDLVGVLQTRLMRGEMGNNLEEGLSSLQTLMSPDHLNQLGAGFHREEALLLINVLSDEDDQSSGASASVVQSMVNRLNSFKRPFRPNVGGWLFNYIGVTGTCMNGIGQFLIGQRYMDLAAMSGGASFPICSANLGDAVRSLRARVLEILTDYPLAQKPNVASIRVFKDGIMVPQSMVNGWDYIPTLQVIRFYGTAIPSVDSKIRVEFTPDSAG